MKQKETAKELGYSSSTIQRHRNDFKMQSLYESNNPKRPQRTLNDLKTPPTEPVTDEDSTNPGSMNKRNIIKGGNPNDSPIHGIVHNEQC